ncbi:MAG: hypothetical protein PF637_00040 [Spirochaetes bacterium]|jgi:hypothetical protein|nr:hypothetical protein [Spirochaetota bacterium]
MKDKKGDTFLSYKTFGKKASIRAIDRALRDADWKKFHPSRDLYQLRSVLNKIEVKKGVTSLHYFCTSKIENMGARLALAKNDYRYPNRYTALRADGAYCAFFFSDDESCEIVIVEVLTGACVNKIETTGSWPDDFCARWSPDGHSLAYFCNETTLVCIDPFADYCASELTSVELSLSQFSMQAWCFSPDSLRIVISVKDSNETQIPLLFILLATMKAEEPKHDFNIPDKLAIHLLQQPLSLLTLLRWSSSKNLIYGINSENKESYAFDADTLELVSFTKPDEKIAWSDRSLYLTRLAERMVVTSEAVNLSEIESSFVNDSALAVFSTDRRRVAIVPDFNENGPSDICIFDGNRRSGVIESEILSCVGVVGVSALAWSRCGFALAVITHKHRMQVWDVSQNPHLLSSTQVNESAFGLVAGRSGRYLVVGPRSIELVNGQGGSLISSISLTDNQQKRVSLDERSMFHHFVAMDDQHIDDVGYAYNREHPLPAHMVHLLKIGHVLCSQETKSLLKDELHYVLHNRYIWPFHWGSYDRILCDLKHDNLLNRDQGVLGQQHILEPKPGTMFHGITNSRIH